MQAVRAGIRALRSSYTCRSLNGESPVIYYTVRGGFIAGTRVFSQSALCASTSLDKTEVTSRVLDLLKSVPFVDPSKVNLNADFKDDLQLNMMDNVEVMMAVEEEFAVDIPDSEANKIATTAHLIDYIASHPQAK